LRNAVTGGDCPDPAITDPTDPDFDADCVVIDDISAWTVTKTSNASDPVLPGDVVEYTLTVENLGNVPLTAAEVSIEDDLWGVLDDATLDEASISASSGTASFSDPVLTWTGDLDVDQVVTITYSVEVLPAESLGDGQLLNAVTGSPNCPDPAVTDPTDPDFDPDCVTISDIEAWTVVKTSDAADPVQPGDAITYTLTVENTGNVALSDVEVSDDLSGVLDDATLDEASISASSGTASFSDPVLTWSGDLSVDQVATITYSVEVLPSDSLGDGVLRNAVTGGDCPDPAITDPTDPDFDPDCVTIDPISAYTVTKRSDAADPVLPGDTITYTVAVENTGGTALTGATFSDDLSGVLDDATLDEASITASSGTASFADPVLTWTGDLAVDEVATINYSVTVDQPIGGDHQLVNAVVGGDCPDPAITDPTDPDFDDDCVLVTLLPGVHITKVVFGDPVDDLQPGDSFEYVVTVENIGQVNLVGETFTDDLTEVLDDATLDEASMTATTGTVTFTDPALTCTGDLLVGQIATIRYTIDIDDPVTGDGELFNAVVGSVYSNCAPPDVEDPDCWEETPIPNVHVAKEVVGPTAPQPGDMVTYRITIENRGGAIATDEVVTDDLTGVLDDAVYNGDAAADSGTLDFDHPILTWTGDVPAGETVVITYSVKVNAAGEMGDRTLDNVVTGGENCPDDDVCATTS